MKFPPSVAVLVFLAFSMKAVAFPGVEGRDDGDPSSNESTQRATTDPSDGGSAATASDVEQRGPVATIGETENNAGDPEDSSARIAGMEQLPDRLTSLSGASSTDAEAATDEDPSTSPQIGSDGSHYIAAVPTVVHSSDLAYPGTYPGFSGFSSSATMGASSYRPSAKGVLSSIKIIPQQSITSETLEAAAASVRAAADSARAAAKVIKKAQPNEDASYLIPQLGRFGAVSSASIYLSEIIEGLATTSVPQAQRTVSNAVAVAEQVALKLERAAANLEADIHGMAAHPENRIKLQSIMQEAADATEGAERVAESLRPATSPSDCLLNLTAAAAKQKEKMAAMIQSAAGGNDKTVLKNLPTRSIVTHAVVEIALNAAEAFHTIATVDAMARPDNQVLQDRLAAAATLVVALRSMAMDSYNTAYSLIEGLPRNSRKLRAITLPTYAKTGKMQGEITLTSQSAQRLCSAAMDAAEKLQSFSSPAEDRSTAISNSHQWHQFQENTTQRVRGAVEMLTAPLVKRSHEFDGPLDAPYYSYGYELDGDRVAVYNDAVAAAREEALQASILNRPQVSGLNEVLTTPGDVRSRLEQRPNAFKRESLHAFMQSHTGPTRKTTEISHAPLQYYTGLTRRTTEMAVEETQEAISSPDDLVKPIRKKIATSRMIAAMDIFTEADEASAILDIPYLWRERLEDDKEYLGRKRDGLRTGVEGRAELTPELEKVEQAIKTIVPDSFDEEMVTIPNRPELPKISRQYDDQVSSLATWRKFVSNPEECRLIAASSRQALPALMRLARAAAQSINNKSPDDLYAMNDRTGSSGSFGGLNTIQAALLLNKLLINAADRAVMNPQYRTVFDDAAAAASNAAKAGQVFCNITYKVVHLRMGEQLSDNSYQALQDAVSDAYAAAEEAMNAYDKYNADDSDAAQVAETTKMMSSERNASSRAQALRAQALSVMTQVMDPVISPLPSSVMAIIKDATVRSEAALRRAQEAAALIQSFLDAATAARQNNGGF